MTEKQPSKPVRIFVYKKNPGLVEVDEAGGEHRPDDLTLQVGIEEFVKRSIKEHSSGNSQAARINRAWTSRGE